MISGECENSHRMAAIYIRVSTNQEEQDSSLENQEELLLNEVKINGYQLYRLYAERKSAAKINGRDEFERMLDDAEKGLFKAIFIKDFSRLSRNLETAQRFRRLVVEAKVDVFSNMDGHRATEDLLAYSIKSMFNESYSVDISQKVKASFRESALAGKPRKSEPPYGYYHHEGILKIISPEVSQIINQIYDWFIDGFGEFAIAKKLDAIGAVTPSALKGKNREGRFWHVNSVRYILTNPTYTGDYHQNKQETISVLSSNRKTCETPFIFKDRHEAIISSEKFERVQVQFRSRKKGAPIMANKNLFVGILYCGKCGANYWYRSYGRRYICGTYATHGKVCCNNVAIKEDKLIDAINSDLAELLGNTLNNRTLALELNRKVKRMKDKALKRNAILEDKLQEYESLEADLVMAKVSLDITADEYYQARNNLVDKKKRLLAELAGVGKTLLGLKESDLSKMIKETLIKCDRIDVSNPITLSTFVEKIKIYSKEKIEISYRFSN